MLLEYFNLFYKKKKKKKKKLTVVLASILNI